MICIFVIYCPFHLHSYSSRDIRVLLSSCSLCSPCFNHLHLIARSRTVQRPLFFIHSLSSPNPLTLPSLKALITEVYLKRHDPRIEELTRERRPGRPKPKELLDLEEVKKRETGEYETGMGGFSFPFAMFPYLGFGFPSIFCVFFEHSLRRLVSSSGVSYRIAGLDVLHFRMQSSFVRDCHAHNLVKVLFCFRLYPLFL